jgi:hypothetical protein
MARADFVVAIRQRQHGACAMDAPTQEFEQIERCLVRPMQVLENDQRSLALELVERRVEDCAPILLRAQSLEQRTSRLPRDIVERSERTGCKERVARAPQQTRIALPLRECPHQRRLADAGFADDERDTPSSSRGVEARRELGQGYFAFEELHR